MANNFKVGYAENYLKQTYPKKYFAKKRDNIAQYQMKSLSLQSTSLLLQSSCCMSSAFLSVSR